MNPLACRCAWRDLCETSSKHYRGLPIFRNHYLHIYPYNEVRGYNSSESVIAPLTFGTKFSHQLMDTKIGDKTNTISNPGYFFCHSVSILYTYTAQNANDIAPVNIATKPNSRCFQVLAFVSVELDVEPLKTVHIKDFNWMMVNLSSNASQYNENLRTSLRSCANKHGASHNMSMECENKIKHDKRWLKMFLRGSKDYKTNK